MMETAAIDGMTVAPVEIPIGLAMEEVVPPPVADEAPGLAILTLSPRLAANEVEVWIKASQQAEATETWVVDPRRRSARVCREGGLIRCLRLDQEIEGDAELSEVRRRLVSLLPARAEETLSSGPCTADDLARHPQEDRLELVDGVLKERRLMGARGDVVKSELHYVLSHHCRQSAAGKAYCELGYQFPLQAPKNVRVPDVSFVRQDRVLASWPVKGAAPFTPDLAAEIVSPNDLAVEVEEKINLYLQAGVELIWIIYPDTRSALAIRGDGSGRHLSEDHELDGADLLPGFRCALKSLLV